MNIKMTITIGDIILIITLTILIWQTILLRRETMMGLLRDIYGRWNFISQLEIQDPRFHKMLMSSKTLEKCRKLTYAELKKRAMAHLIFDVFSMIYLLGGMVRKRLQPYVISVSSNPIMQKCWVEYNLRDVWTGEKFQTYMDEIIYQHRNTKRRENTDMSNREKCKETQS